MPALRVLVVDDNDLVVRVISDLLRQRGDLCVSATGAEEALQLIQDNIFDLLLSDMVMPGMDGLELIKRAKILQPALVCILMSGLGTRRDIISALQIGVFDFMDKPVPDMASFNMIVERAGGRSRLIRERDALLESLKQQNSKLEFSLQRLHEAFGQLRQQEEDCFAYFGPCDQVGGDFFGTFPLSDGRMVVYLLDVAGHGVSAAIVTVTLRELMRARMRQNTDNDLFGNPSALLAFMNDAVIEEQFEPPVLVTMIYAVFDPASGRVSFAGAGHPPPFLVTSRSEGRPVPAQGPVLGANTGSVYATTELQLAQGDTLLFYSDGLTETRDVTGTEFSPNRLLELIKSHIGKTAAEVGRAIEEARAKFLEGTAPTDDMTFIVFRRTDPVLKPAPIDTPSIKFVMPEKLRAASPEIRGRIKAGWYKQNCIAVFSGTATWQLAPTLREVIRQAHEGRSAAINIDLAACESMDSTMLGLLLQLASEVTLHQPGARVIQQLHELGVLERFTISHEICPRIEQTMEVSRVQTREACSELILSAHEALMEASVDNRLRFQDVVGSMRQERGSPKPPPS